MATKDMFDPTFEPLNAREARPAFVRGWTEGLKQVSGRKKKLSAKKPPTLSRRAEQQVMMIADGDAPFVSSSRLEEEDRKQILRFAGLSEEEVELESIRQEQKLAAAQSKAEQGNEHLCPPDTHDDE